MMSDESMKALCAVCSFWAFSRCSAADLSGLPREMMGSFIRLNLFSNLGRLKSWLFRVPGNAVLAAVDSVMDFWVTGDGFDLIRLKKL